MLVSFVIVRPVSHFCHVNSQRAGWEFAICSNCGQCVCKAQPSEKSCLATVNNTVALFRPAKADDMQLDSTIGHVLPAWHSSSSSGGGTCRLAPCRVDRGAGRVSPDLQHLALTTVCSVRSKPIADPLLHVASEPGRLLAATQRLYEMTPAGHCICQRPAVSHFAA